MLGANVVPMRNYRMLGANVVPMRNYRTCIHSATVAAPPPLELLLRCGG